MGHLGNKQVDAGNVISWTAARHWNITWFNWMTFSLLSLAQHFALNVCFSQCWLTDCIWLLEKFPCPVQRQMNISAHYKNVYFVSINIVLIASFISCKWELGSIQKLNLNLVYWILIKLGLFLNWCCWCEKNLFHTWSNEVTKESPMAGSPSFHGLGG